MSNNSAGVYSRVNIVQSDSTMLWIVHCQCPITTMHTSVKGCNADVYINDWDSKRGKKSFADYSSTIDNNKIGRAVFEHFLHGWMIN